MNNLKSDLVYQNEQIDLTVQNQENQIAFIVSQKILNKQINEIQFTTLNQIITSYDIIWNNIDISL